LPVIHSWQWHIYNFIASSIFLLIYVQNCITSTILWFLSLCIGNANKICLKILYIEMKDNNSFRSSFLCSIMSTTACHLVLFLCAIILSDYPFSLCHYIVRLPFIIVPLYGLITLFLCTIILSDYPFSMCHYIVWLLFFFVPLYCLITLFLCAIILSDYPFSLCHYIVW
jgi:hypothetical protein